MVSNEAARCGDIQKAKILVKYSSDIENLLIDFLALKPKWLSN
jgi:hypothetical protein